MLKIASVKDCVRERLCVTKLCVNYSMRKIASTREKLCITKLYILRLCVKYCIDCAYERLAVIKLR